jgi:hypothetical protein
MNRLNISSGIKFQKTFGDQLLNTRPFATHNGIIISNNNFITNQYISVLLENNQYYVEHGLPDSFEIYESLIAGFDPSGVNTQSFNVQNNNAISLLEQKLYNAISLNNISININTSNIAPIDPYDNNPPPDCSLTP